MTNTQIRAGEALAEIIRQTEIYCSAHRAMFSSPIGEDGVLSHGATLIMRGVEELLNGELGNQDGGDLSGKLYAIATQHSLIDDNGEF
jgi:hypothetical protein